MPAKKKKAKESGSYGLDAKDRKKYGGRDYGYGKQKETSYERLKKWGGRY